VSSLKALKFPVSQLLFHQQIYLQIFCTKVVSAAYMYIEKAAKTTFVQKICTKNVDEIDTWFSTSISSTNLCSTSFIALSL